MTATSRTTVSTTSRVAPPKASTTGTPGGLSRPGVKPASGGQTGGARIMPPNASGSARGLQRRDSTSSTTSVSSSVSTVSTKSASKIKTSLDKTKRSGTGRKACTVAVVGHWPHPLSMHPPCCTVLWASSSRLFVPSDLGVLFVPFIIN
ncbi:hypothetical protein DPMN_140333 [Dreissena polymorpha]|uniref:Uncharacterized protein n=1 Tax=Dreissena polymorpha TaxID=45954 RepID=A0A9D4GAN9_DREPO|nr:hypothetical protein DPMN_140333 [Dreissena polymorpha]